MRLMEVPSDLDDATESHDYWAGKWTVFSDIYGVFGGSFGLFLILSLLLPGAMVASVLFGWAERPEMALLGAGLVFVVCLTLSLHSLAWYVWAKRRERIAFVTMQQLGVAELAREE